MQRPSGRRFLTVQLVAVVVPLVLLALAGSGAHARERSAGQTQDEPPQSRLEIAALDLAQFPTVGVNLIVTDRQSRPLRELGALRVRENGAPIADYELALLTAGTELFLVVDANSRIQEADDESGLTRLQKVKDSILTYAGGFMDLAGRDRVTVIVPGAEGARVLAEEVTAPGALIEAVRPYDAGRLPESEVMEMMALALERAAGTKDAGRFQAIVLYTDATGLNEARFGPLIAQARALQIPIFVLLLGAGETASESAAATAAALTEPTRGFFAPMPAASDSSEVFQVIADNGVQSQVRYASNIRRSGAYSLSVTLEGLRDETALDLQLAPPEVRLQAPGRIERAGTQPDTPLAELQPAVQPLTAQITWPDGLPRRLQGASLMANGRVQDAPFFGGGEMVAFDWDIADLEAGQYELTVVVTDTLGMAGRSEGQAVTIALSRPEALSTPDATPTPEALHALRGLLPPLSLPARGDVEPYVAPLGAALAALALGFLLARRRSSGQDVGAPDEPAHETELEAAGEAAGEAAYLEMIGGSSGAAALAALALAGRNVTIGSAAGEVRLCLAEGSISGLHARIRRREGAYWLYDEGSEQGTFLNHERLGLAPKQVRDGDEVQLGRVRFRFRVVKEGDERVAHVGREGEND